MIMKKIIIITPDRFKDYFTHLLKPTQTSNDKNSAPFLAKNEFCDKDITIDEIKHMLQNAKWRRQNTV